jgi:hypothetical protein
MSGLVRADGWEAVFQHEAPTGAKHTESHEVVAWYADQGGQVVGMITGGKKGEGLRSAESFTNFAWYRRREECGTPVAASPGWWVVSQIEDEPERAWWTRVVAWLIDANGWVWAASTVASRPDGLPAEPVVKIEEDTRCYYDPSRTEEGKGPWPWAEAARGEEA